MSILEGLARHLDAEGLATWDANGAGGDLFVDTVPQGPDTAVSLFGYGGPETPAGHPYDSPSVQVQVRGGPDPRTSRDRAQAIYEALHGLHHVLLPDGTFLVDCVGIQSSPQSLGVDANGRHRHVINFRCEIRRS